jgi:hypothetical protein
MRLRHTYHSPTFAHGIGVFEPDQEFEIDEEQGKGLLKNPYFELVREGEPPDESKAKPESKTEATKAKAEDDDEPERVGRSRH